MIPIFLSLMLLTSFGSSAVYSLADAESSSVAEEEPRTIEVLARNKGEVFVIWIKNLKSDEIYSIRLQLVRSEIKSYTTPPGWSSKSYTTPSGWSSKSDQGILLHTENEPLRQGKTLRLKIISLESDRNPESCPKPVYINWEAFGEVVYKYTDLHKFNLSGGVQPTVLFMPKPMEGIPAHGYLYKDGRFFDLRSGGSLTGISGLEEVEMSRFSALSIRDGFEIKKVWCSEIPHPVYFTIAKRVEKDMGFVILHKNWTQGAFVFSPLESGDEALQYLQFMTHTTSTYYGDWDFSEIYSMAQYEETIKKMEDFAEGQVDFLKDPPTKITRVNQDDGLYNIERIFSKISHSYRIIYSNSVVYPDGMVEVIEEYVVVQGAATWII